MACGVNVPQAALTAPTPQSTAPVSVPQPIIPLPPGAPLSTTTLAFSSEPGEYIGQGLTRTYYLGDGFWSARFDTDFGGGHVSIRLDLGAVARWDLDFSSPKGQPLTVGTYENARRYRFQPEGQPGLDFTGYGRGCNLLTGRFVVTDIIVRDNTVERFAATFEQRCDSNLDAAVRGQVVIAADPWR